MTDCSTYIGDLKDPTFRWKGGDWSSNSPARISPFFPPQDMHYNGDFHKWVKTREVVCRQTDYGCWVAKVTKKQLQDYLENIYGKSKQLPWVQATLPDVEAFVKSLNGRKKYALVATEF